nr:MAG TPA: hypothetical protein [Caudoviricetes sp.]
MWYNKGSFGSNLRRDLILADGLAVPLEIVSFKSLFMV